MVIALEVLLELVLGVLGEQGLGGEVVDEGGNQSAADGSGVVVVKLAVEEYSANVGFHDVAQDF